MLNKAIITKIKNSLLFEIEEDRRHTLEINEGKCDPKFTNMLYDQKRQGVVDLYFKLLNNV